jgi:hypothetical protein
MVFNALGQGLRAGGGGNQLITIHSTAPNISSSANFHDSAWLDFNMLQSGHTNDNDAWGTPGYPENRTAISADYARIPTKPVLDGEPAYEDVPDGLYMSGVGANGPRMGPDVVRRKAYGAVFAGACGHTYGHNDMWGFWVPGATNANPAGRNSWQTSIYAAGAAQMQHLRRLMESKSQLIRIPDQSLIVSNPGSGTNYIQATRGSDGSYAMVYIPTGNAVTLDMSMISGGGANCSWYDPRSGAYTAIGTFANSGTRSFDAPGTTANGNDWVLVLSTTTTVPPGNG